MKMNIWIIYENYRILKYHNKNYLFIFQIYYYYLDLNLKEWNLQNIICKIQNLRSRKIAKNCKNEKKNLTYIEETML